MRIIFLPFLSALLLSGAGCISSDQDFGQVLDGESVKEEAVASTADEDALLMTTYRTGGKNVIVFDAPTGWFARQLDGGGFSVVQIRETEQSPLQASIAVETPWPDDEGHRATYDEWLVLRGLTQPAVRAIKSDRVTFDVWEPQDEEVVAYTLLLDPQDLYYLHVVMPSAFDQATARAIIRSINPFATQEEQDAAVPIR